MVRQNRTRRSSVNQQACLPRRIGFRWPVTVPVFVEDENGSVALFVSRLTRRDTLAHGSDTRVWALLTRLVEEVVRRAVSVDGKKKQKENELVECDC